jgi:hypothetical protein
MSPKNTPVSLNDFGVGHFRSIPGLLQEMLLGNNGMMDSLPTYFEMFRHVATASDMEMALSQNQWWLLGILGS